MLFSDISTYRLIAQCLADPSFSTPKQAVEWMGAMQAQDLQMSLLGVALRIRDVTVKEVENALGNGEILRTHLMRPTWHLVSADDIYWILDLTAPALKRMSATRNRQLELTDEIFRKSFTILETALQGKELPREKITRILNAQGIKTDENRLSHILGMAEYEQLVCNGSVKGSKQNYALLAEKVPEKKTFSREESVLKLTERFFRSHAPATVTDFAWWSFLPLKEIRWALEELKNTFEKREIENEVYYFPPELRLQKLPKTSLHLLPAFDEFLVSYKSKNVCVPDEHRVKAATMNGVFKPIIVQNGQIIGTWKKVSASKSVNIAVDFFEKENVGLEKEPLFQNKILKLWQSR